MTSQNQSTKKQTESEQDIAPKRSKLETAGKVADAVGTGVEWTARVIIGVIFIALGLFLFWLITVVPSGNALSTIGLVVFGGLAILNGVNALRGARYWTVI